MRPTCCLIIAFLKRTSDKSVVWWRGFIMIYQLPEVAASTSSCQHFLREQLPFVFFAKESIIVNLYFKNQVMSLPLFVDGAMVRSKQPEARAWWEWFKIVSRSCRLNATQYDPYEFVYIYIYVYSHILPKKQT